MEHSNVFMFVITVVTLLNLSNGMGLCEFEARFPGATYSCYDKSGCDAIFHNGWSSSCYFISKHELLHSEAVDYCAAYRTHLVFIETEEEQEAIVGWLSAASSEADPRDYWIGLAGRTAMEVSWMNGKPLNYTNFVYDTPDDSFNEKSGLYRMMPPYYQWHDRVITYKYFFICERELNSTKDTKSFTPPTDSGCIMLDDEAGRSVVYNSTHSQGRYPDSTEAQFTCGDHQELVGESVVRCHTNEWNGVGHCCDNVALHKPAYQSSTRSSNTGLASYAFDGDTSGLWLDYSCTHTDGAGSTNPWLTVDLTGTFIIGLIRVYNRLDANLGNRLVGADVIVIQDNNETVVATLGNEVIATPTDILVDMVVGTHVTVYLKGTNKILTVCELEVYGIPVKLTSTEY